MLHLKDPHLCTMKTMKYVMGEVVTSLKFFIAVVFPELESQFCPGQQYVVQKLTLPYVCSDIVILQILYR